MNETEKQRPLNPNEWVNAYGNILYKFALTRLRNPEKAENVVQETFLAALKGRHKFQGKATERTWLMGILKHKIIDHIRAQYREQAISELEFEDSSNRWDV